MQHPTSTRAGQRSESRAEKDGKQTTHDKSEAPSDVPALSPEIAELIRQAIQKVRHGTVQLIIQDNRVVQIDTTDKNRLT